MWQFKSSARWFETLLPWEAYIWSQNNYIVYKILLVASNLASVSWSLTWSPLDERHSTPGIQLLNLWKPQSCSVFSVRFSSVTPIQNLAVTYYILGHMPARNWNIQLSLEVFHQGPDQVLIGSCSGIVKILFRFCSDNWHWIHWCYFLRKMLDTGLKFWLLVRPEAGSFHMRTISSYQQLGVSESFSWKLKIAHKIFNSLTKSW
jgi:hypothetical protein